MEYEHIPYQSYCWCLGTTSFRTKQLNRSIEWQLALLDEFWQNHEQEHWERNDWLQSEYYRFLQAKGFVQGQAPRPAKDAREKTSGLVTLGLITDRHVLSPAGTALLAITQEGVYTPNNLLELPRDSYCYFKQLLKASVETEEGYVRPFLVLIYLLDKLDYLTDDEFAYLLPLCLDPDTTDEIVDAIRRRRAQNFPVDRVLVDRFMARNNYQSALTLFLEAGKVTEELMLVVGMNRKSGAKGEYQYDRRYAPLYHALEGVVVRGEEAAIPAVYQAADALTLKKWWKKLLFGGERKAKRNPKGYFRREAFGRLDQNAFRRLFFLYMHLYKMKSTLYDYKDLNRRYFRLTDTVLFSDGTVKLDVVPRQFFRQNMDALWPGAFRRSGKLWADCPLEDIAPGLAVEPEAIIQGINQTLGCAATTMEEARQAVRDERHQRFDRLIDAKFSDGVLLALLDQFQDRDDVAIQAAVTDNADVPTIFEYVLGILWYKLSGRRGNILDYMNLSLEADLLPKTHAGGGEADIVYQYDEGTAAYSPHTLLLEATLVDNTGQRRMEEEPVTRHLGHYLLDHPEREAYCVFAAPHLDINAVAAFRAKRNTPWYDAADWDRHVPGMKVIPLSTGDLKKILSNGRTYEELYPVFEAAYASEEADVRVWLRQLQERIVQQDGLA